MRTSARNQFTGEIVRLTEGAVNDEIVLSTSGGLEIVAVITRESTKSLGLAVGKPALGLVKASSVMIMLDARADQVSARNFVQGKVSAIQHGAVNSDVTITSEGGSQISAIITNASIQRLNLSVGVTAAALFKASSVIIAVE